MCVCVCVCVCVYARTLMPFYFYRTGQLFMIRGRAENEMSVTIRAYNGQTLRCSGCVSLGHLG